MGINGAQSPLASLMGAHRTVRARAESRKKTGFIPFSDHPLLPSSFPLSIPHFPQSLPSSKSPSYCSVFFPASPSLHPAQAKALCSYPTSQRDKLKCVAHTLSLSVCLIFLETKAQCKCSIFFASDSLYLVKSCRLRAAFAHLTGKHVRTNRNMFRILNPSGQISLIWAENKILTNKKAHNVDTHVWIKSIQSRNNKTSRHSHSHDGAVGKCHQVIPSRTILAFSPSLCASERLVWPFDGKIS